jgi:hypothetical protein
MNDALSSQNLKLLFRHGSRMSPGADFASENPSASIALA